MAIDRPNIIVILCDQLKATALSAYGNSVCRTPSIERLAQEGVTFGNACTPHPLCVPARVSLWTGQYPHTHGSQRNQTYMRPGRNHAFRIWKSMGYQCGFIGKNHCFDQPDDIALFDTWNEIDHLGIPDGAPHAGLPWQQPVSDIQKAHSVRHHMPRQGTSFSYATSRYPLEHYGTSVVAEQSVRFLETSCDGPFALWVSFPDPHSPIEAPERYTALFPTERIELPPRHNGEMDNAPERTRILARWHGWGSGDEEHVRRTIGIYYAMTRFIDDAVGRILDALDRLDLRRRTIVVFCSDHGDFTGEHGIMDKGGAFYDCLTRVPLIASFPGRCPAGRRDDSMANLVDIVPTLLRLQGAPIPREMQGSPLPTVTAADPRDAAFSEYGAGGPPFTMADAEQMRDPFRDSLQWREAEGMRKMVRTQRWKYVHDPMGDRDELYDLLADPGELTNLESDPASQSALADMRRRLMCWRI